MSYIRISSPHLHKPTDTSAVMRLVILATLPGLIALTVFFGWGNLINVIWASVLAIGFEAACIKLRKRPLKFYLKDNSALLTAVLLGLALPPFAPWWLTAVAVFVAIVVAKQMYGGLGQNPFNPAMVGYALVLVSFPVEMTRWTAPLTIGAGDWQLLSFTDTLNVIFGGWQSSFDAYSGATPLDAMRHRSGLTTSEVWQSSPVMANFGIWLAVNIAYFAGGIFLIYRKIFTWHTPLAMLGAILVGSTFIYLADPDNFLNPLLHLTMGATMLGAFFIATDPVSSATSNRGKIYYGIGIGLLVIIIRTWGSYPDAVAFAVLLMNLAAPFIDHYSQPRTYGHKKANRGAKASDGK